MNVYVLLVIYSILQALDVWTTLANGGLVVEGNPIVVYLWTAGGIVVPLALKVVVGGLLCIVWGLYDMWPELNKFK